MSSLDVLPRELKNLLGRIGSALEARTLTNDDVEVAIQAFNALSAGLIVRASAEITLDAKLSYRDRGLLGRILGNDRTAHLQFLEKMPRLAHLFLFHSDGHLREASLNQIDGALESPFFFAAIAWRLNDWVPQVRSAARACADRTFVKTDASLIAAAQSALLVKARRWGRWQGAGSELQSAFGRPDVGQAIFDAIMSGKNTGTGAVLRAVLQESSLDAKLIALFEAARLAEVRAIALRTLVTGCFAWRSGYEWQWENKVYGFRKRRAIIVRREIEHTIDVAPLIRRGAADKSAMVRRAAADGLVHHRFSLPSVDEIVAGMLTDESPAVRWRADFVRRNLAEVRAQKQ